MSNYKIASVVKSLIVNTQNGNLRWKESKIEDAFEYSFSHSTIVIKKVMNNNCINLYIYNDEGKIIESLSDKDLFVYIEEPYQELSDLYDTARRQAMGVEDALDEMLSELHTISENSSPFGMENEDDLGEAFPIEEDKGCF